MRHPPPALPLLRRLAAFTDDPLGNGGNPAGVWVGESLPSPAEMQGIAAEVGYSETAFVARRGQGGYEVRYFSPEAEVSFCGHATIATGVLLGELEGAGTYTLSTAVGEVPVSVEWVDGGWTASLTSVEPRVETVPPELLDEALAALGWRPGLLDLALPPKLAYAGAWHLVVAVAERSTLDGLEYDFERLKRAMLAAGLTTLQLVWRESAETFHARNPFPVGGVVEDPATGAAAAALGGYLRAAGLVAPPAHFLIRQGEAMGRPSRIEVDVPVLGGITVSGGALPIRSVPDDGHGADSRSRPATTDPPPPPGPRPGPR